MYPKRKHTVSFTLLFNDSEFYIQYLTNPAWQKCAKTELLFSEMKDKIAFFNKQDRFHCPLINRR